MRNFQLFFILFVFYSVSKLKAQAPSNDDCSGAVVLTTDVNCLPITGSVNGATNSGIPVSSDCSASNPDDDVWFTFVATCSSEAVEITSSANFSPSFEVFSGTCGSLTSILCVAPNFSGVSISGQVSTISGQTYYVRVYDYNIAYPPTTSFSICVTNIAPYNNNCIGSTPIYPPYTCVPITGDVCGSTLGAGAGSCGGNDDDDVWYTFNPTNTTQRITVVGSIDFDAVVQISYGCSAGPTWCINATGVGGTETSTISPLTIGHNYRIRVWDFGTGYPPTTTFTICVTDSSSVGIQEIFNSASKITISPNPFSTETTLHTATLFKGSTLIMYNSFGQQVKKIKDISGETISLTRDNLPCGVYFLRLLHDSKIFTIDKLFIIDE